MSSLAGLYFLGVDVSDYILGREVAVRSGLNSFVRKGIMQVAPVDSCGAETVEVHSFQVGEFAVFNSPRDRPFPLPVQKYKGDYDKCMSATDMPELEKMTEQRKVFRVPDQSTVSKVKDIDHSCSLVRIVSVPEGKIRGAVGHTVVVPNEFLGPVQLQAVKTE